jgi:hypothetical protein
VYVKQVAVARGKDVHLLLDIAGARPNNWAVAVAYKGRVYDGASGIEAADADYLYDLQQVTPGPEFDAGWNAVLDRLMDKDEGQADWAPVNLATQFFPVGSWNWLVTLKIIRAAIAANSGEKHEQ